MVGIFSQIFGAFHRLHQLSELSLHVLLDVQIVARRVVEDIPDCFFELEEIDDLVPRLHLLGKYLLPLLEDGLAHELRDQGNGLILQPLEKGEVEDSMGKKFLIVIGAIEKYILKPFLFMKNALNVLQNGPSEDS